MTKTGESLAGSSINRDERRTDTRAQIRTVALELFAEQGYDKTSLREIAERLGVTKAAVYYHFKTKEEILGNLLDDFLAQVDEVVRWGQAQPVSAQTRREVLRRYGAVLDGGAAGTVRFVHEMQASIKDLQVGEQMRERFMALNALLVGADAPLEKQLRGRLALISLHVAAAAPGLDGTPQERMATALKVAVELADAGDDEVGLPA